MTATIATIQAEVSKHYGIDVIDMLSDRRAMAVSRPRQIAMYIAKRLTTGSLPSIGRKFGDRDHTTVIHAVRRIEALRLEDEDMDFDIATLSRRIMAKDQEAYDAAFIGWMA